MLLRAVLVGAILFVATVFVLAQTVRDTVGPLEKSATQSSPENPIPRRLSAPPAARVQEWRQVPGRGFVRFQVTLDTAGRVAEIRNLIEPAVQIPAGLTPVDDETRRAIADAIMKSAAASVSQWTYEPPKAPITFGVAFTFPSGADPIAVQEPTPPSPRGGGPSPVNFGGGQQPLSVNDFGAAAGAVRVGGTVKPPVQTKKVNPVYPQAAQLERVAGLVILEVIIGTDGKVRDGRVMRSVAFLDEAAIEAVRQWEYTPTEHDGKPVPVVMTVTVSFNMDVGIPEPPLTVFPWPAAVGAVRAGFTGTVAVPRQTKNARPDFPGKARSAGRMGGAVLLELLVGTNGKVTDVRVIRSSPLFDNEALETARKWEFEPTLVNGVPTPVVVPATVMFSTSPPRGNQ
jgi:TonB family protein